VAEHTPGPWYSRLGPLSWYRREWVRFELTAGSRLIVHAQWKPGLSVRIEVGGRVHSWSRYGGPASVEPWRSWAWFSAKAKRRMEGFETMARGLIREKVEQN
jgi:hypothetical protein